MPQHTINTLVFFSITTLSIPLSTSASAVTVACGLRDSTPNGEVDIGSGLHQFGFPQHSATITFTLTSFNGVNFVTARFQGTLYLDKIFAGCARARINFQDINSNNLQSTSDTHFCGPGNDANSPQNKRNIDITSFANQNLRRVQVVLGEGSSPGSIEDAHVSALTGPGSDTTFTTIIDKGTADFGGNSHFLGSPSSPAFVELAFSNNNVFGRVTGALYWDSLFSSGTSRMDIDFMRANNTVLHTDVNQIHGSGGDANNDSNKTGVFRLFNNPSLRKIRLRLGPASNGFFTGAIETRTFSFTCN